MTPHELEFALAHSRRNLNRNQEIAQDYCTNLSRRLREVRFETDYLIRLREIEAQQKEKP